MEQTNKIVVKKQLRLIRENLGLSRQKVAIKMNISVRILEKIEKGEREVRLNEANALAEIYSMSLDDILLANEKEINEIEKCPKK